ncbi:hypothetical protein ACFMPD_07080 [Sedimentitalea sp. HM32M-2]
MFGLIRLAIFVLLAFVTGVFYERSAHTDRCLDAGGRVTGGLCEGGQR